jgi:hypothetical protein
MYLGTVTIEPSTPVVAGSVGQWTITLTVGSAGIDEGGTIKIAQRFASDWEAPQFDRPKDPAFTTVTTNGAAKLRPRYDRKGHERPWMACIVIDVYHGSLSPGETVTVILGDRSQGAPGIRAQTFQETSHEFRVLVDPTNACLVRPVEHSPCVQLIAGETAELVCIVPTQATAGGASRIFVRGQDKWGNPTPAASGLELLYAGTGKARIDEAKLTFEWPGSGAVHARAGSWQCVSNPITAYAERPQYSRWWGDMHAQSDATVGTGSEEEYFTFARDSAALDFCSHQGNDFQVRDEDWQKLNDTVRTFHRDHAFVVFPGWEWSGNTSVGGDRNVWYLEEDMPIFRSSHWQVPQVPENASSPAPTAADLFKRVRMLPAEKVLLGSHVGGRYADIRKHFDETLGPLVEVVSCWGVFEWMLWDAFDCGYTVGVVCNSDGHKGRPGAEGPGAGQFGIANGLTCVLAEELTRAGIFRALKERRCYGTTGARIDLDLQIDNAPMGSVISTGKTARLKTTVTGTAPLESVRIFRGKEVLHTWQPEAFRQLGDSRKIRVSWKGSRIRGRARRVTWDGKVLLSGATIVSAEGHFDTPVDRITSQSANEIDFISQTTGDADWIDVIVDLPGQGRLTFDSKAGKCDVPLADLTNEAPRKTYPFGGLDMEVTIQRYPEHVAETRAAIRIDIVPPNTGKTPYFVKVTQVDGHMAWSSPIYVTREL